MLSSHGPCIELCSTNFIAHMLYLNDLIYSIYSHVRNCAISNNKQGFCKFAIVYNSYFDGLNFKCMNDFSTYLSSLFDGQ